MSAPSHTVTAEITVRTERGREGGGRRRLLQKAEQMEKVHWTGAQPTGWAQRWGVPSTREDGGLPGEGAAPEEECELESRSAQPGHQPQGISQAQQPPPPDWTMLGQDSSAPPLQTQSWTRVLREAPEWSRRLQVRADPPCRAADWTSAAMWAPAHKGAPKPVESQGRGRDESRPASQNRTGAPVLEPSCSRELRTDTPAPTSTLGKTPERTAGREGLQRAKGPEEAGEKAARS